MAPLGALSQAWTAAEASLPLGWQTNGLYRYRSSSDSGQTWGKRKALSPKSERAGFPAVAHEGTTVAVAWDQPRHRSGVRARERR